MPHICGAVNIADFRDGGCTGAGSSRSVPPEVPGGSPGVPFTEVQGRRFLPVLSISLRPRFDG